MTENKKAEMAPQPPTVTLPKPSEADIRHQELKGLISSSIGALDVKVAAGFQRVDANLKAVANDVTVTKGRVHGLESRVGSLEDRASRTSMSIGRQSDSNLEQEARIAAEIVARTTLGEDVVLVKTDVTDLKASNVVQLQILQRLDTVFKHKAVKLLLLALGVAATSYLASKGVHIGSP